VGRKEGEGRGRRTYALLRLLTDGEEDPTIRVMRTNTLTLSIQANREDIGRDFQSKLRAWSPAWAKSFHLVRFEHTDYSGRSVAAPTGYARFEVEYRSNLTGVMFEKETEV
jgi:hypothetical protein